MTRARGVAWLSGVLGGVAVATAVAAVVVALSRVDFGAAGLADLLAACRRWALLDGGPASAAVLVLGASGTAVLAMTVRSAIRQLRATRRFVARLPVVGRLPARPAVRLVEDPAPQAFCIGLLRPRVYLSTGAAGLLSEPELEAVLAHEAHHVRCRDPLRLLLLRAVAEGLFVLPALRRLSERYAALAELAADEAAERATDGRRALASALLAFQAHPDPAVVGIAPERVDRLLGERATWGLPVALLVVAVPTLSIAWALTVRVSQVSHASMSVPEMLAQACMLAMAAVPLLLGGGALLGARRLVRRP